jgi:hypothetical protein
MTKKMKFTLLLSHLILLGVGLIVGTFWPLGKLTREYVMMTSQGNMIGHFAALTDVTRSHGDREAYKKSLLAYLSVLDDVNKHPSEFFDTKITSTDKAFVYEKLSRLERESGNATGADDYLNLAVQACRESGMKDCSIEKISLISKKMEGSSMVSSKKEDTKKEH